MQDELLQKLLPALITKTRDGSIAWKQRDDLTLRINFARSSIEISQAKDEDTFFLDIFNSDGVVVDHIELKSTDECGPQLAELLDIANDSVVHKSETLTDILENLGLAENPTPDVIIEVFTMSRGIVSRGDTLTLHYRIRSSHDASNTWLGANFGDTRAKLFYNIRQDEAIILKKGTHSYERILTIPPEAALGSQPFRAEVWQGVVGDSNKSKRLAFITTTIIIT